MGWPGGLAPVATDPKSLVGLEDLESGELNRVEGLFLSPKLLLLWILWGRR